MFSKSLLKFEGDRALVSIDKWRCGIVSLSPRLKSLVIDYLTWTPRRYARRRCGNAIFSPFSFQKVQYYTKIARDYRAAIDEVLWNEDEGVWLDYDARNKRSRNGFYPSNLSPLYTMSYDQTKKTDYALRAVAYLKRNNVDEYLGKFVLIVGVWALINAWSLRL